MKGKDGKNLHVIHPAHLFVLFCCKPSSDQEGKEVHAAPVGIIQIKLHI